jgi:hypothetical protein
MVNINHSNLTDPYLHEPKGVASATSGKVYVSDGSGSGDWTQPNYQINGYVDFDATTPAYQHSVTTSFTALNPTFLVTLADGFTGTATPNARLVYTGTDTIISDCSFACNFRNNSGSNKTLELVFYKNGALMNGGHVIVTAVSGEWRSVVLNDLVSLSTNDYVEIFIKGDAAFTLDVATASLIMKGVPA